MSRARKPHPLIQAIERALTPGTFIAYGRSWDFVRSLDEVKDRLDAMVKAGQAREDGTRDAVCRNKGAKPAMNPQ